MATILQNIERLGNDKNTAINNYKEAGVELPMDATFTDLNQAFQSLPIMDVTVEGTELVFGSLAEVVDGELVIGGDNE